MDRLQVRDIEFAGNGRIDQLCNASMSLACFKAGAQFPVSKTGAGS